MDTCFLCGVARDEHIKEEAAGQIHHQFAREGEGLRANAQNSRKTAPQRYAGGAREDQVILKLLMVLTEKGVLLGEDLRRILGGTIESDLAQRNGDGSAPNPGA